MSSKQSQLNPVTNNSKAIAAALPKPCGAHNMPPCALDAARVARMFCTSTFGSYFDAVPPCLLFCYSHLFKQDYILCITDY